MIRRVVVVGDAEEERRWSEGGKEGEREGEGVERSVHAPYHRETDKLDRTTDIF